MSHVQSKWMMLACAIAIAFAGCGQKKDLGKNVSIGVKGDGIILNSDMQTCGDIYAGQGNRSATSYALFFSSFSITWTDTSKSLLVTNIQLTVTGSNIAADTIVNLNGDELQALMGLKTMTLSTGAATSVTVESADPTRTTYPPCNLVVGGITPISKTLPNWTAMVEIKLIGVASSATGDSVERVEKIINVPASY